MEKVKELDIAATSQSELCGGLNLSCSSADKALVHTIVFPLEIKNLQRLLVCNDPSG